MHRLTKYTLTLIVLTTFIFIGLTTNVFAGPYTSGRIIPSDTVGIYSGDTLIGQYTEEAPLPLQSILKCSGDCAVRMTDLYIRVKGNTPFSVDDTSENRTLLIKEGALFFALPKLEKQLVIVTSAGAITVQEAVLEAANQNDNILSGYVNVTSEQTEVGVIEGGALIVSTSDGQSTIQSGNRLLLLAQAKPITKPNLSQSELESLMGNGAGAMEEEDDHTYWPAWLAVITTGGLLFSQRDENPQNQQNDRTGSNPAP